MQCYTELIPPSGVTHAVSLPFTGPDARNLIVARTSLLQIFATKELANGQDTKLILVAEYSLPGTITALGRVSLLKSKSGGDAVLLALRDAKLSLVEWDAKQHSISTISIHYYEGEELQKCPWAPELRDCVSYLTIDPSSRCAAFNFGIGNLAIVPFHQLGDDLAADDQDDDLDGEERSPTKQINGDVNSASAPYASSFVLPLTVLDSGLLHPIHFAFLHEYREPTFGILYSTAARSANLSFERKDITIYAVFTLDLDQKASTTLLSIPKLPNDLYKVISLPQPVSGALLVGGNELIHVDQGGKCTAIGVNEFAKQNTSFGMADHSDYDMRLEGCQIEQMGNSAGDMLVVFADAEIAVLSFRLDGRLVAGLSLTRVPATHVQDIFKGAASCINTLGQGCLFVGSEVADSVLLGTARKPSQVKRQNSRAHIQTNGGIKTELSDEDEDDSLKGEDEDDDDLYAETVTQPMTAQPSDASTVLDSTFRLLDRLPSTASLKNIAFGRSSKRKREAGNNNAESPSALELASACCEGRAGSIAIYSRNIMPNLIKSQKHEANDRYDGIWSFAVKRRKSAQQEAAIEEKFHNHILLSKTTVSGEGESLLFSLSNGDLEPRTDVEFDTSAGATVQVGTVLKGSHTVQVLETDVRVYDSDFGLAHIEPIVDEDSGSEARVLGASIIDPYIAITKDDFSVLLLKADKKGELEEIELPEFSPGTQFVSATLYDDETDFFDTKRFYGESQGPLGSNLLLTLLTVDGSLRLLSLPNIDINVFSYDGLHFLPPMLANDVPIPKHWRNKDLLVEAVVADLGDRSHQSPYIVLRNSSDDIVLYEPFQVPGSVGSFQFKKATSRRLPKYSAAVDANENTVTAKYKPALHPVKNVDGFSSVFITGFSPASILKSASSPLRIHSIRSPRIHSISGCHDPTCRNGFAYLDENNSLHLARLPSQTDFGSSDWTVQKIEMGEEVSAITYFERTDSYVVTTNQVMDFQLPQDDEWHQEWRDEKTGFLPQVAQSSLKLVSSKTHRTISTFTFDPAERAMCVQCLNLEVSEETHERKDLIVVGTAIVKGENVSARGALYIFDVADVVPVPDVPETDLKLKLVAKEEVKGAVTAISEVGTQGFVLAAQGQKCMVRGLKEDHTILPVAFMDMRYYVNVVKSLKGTGLCILGDAVSGLWLIGYCEEPYKMQMIGRDPHNLDVVAAEFLPDGKQLYIISCDGEGELQVMQYDPENPRTERGMKLLHRSTFNTGSFPTSMTLLPRTPVSSEVVPTTSGSGEDMDVELPEYATYQILVTTQEGGLTLITPLSDASYRRLSTLQNILISNLEHSGGLNPRAYRAVETDGVGGRGMIDGSIVMRWLDQSSQHKASMADKIGGTVWDIRADLESISGAGLGYL